MNSNNSWTIQEYNKDGESRFRIIDKYTQTVIDDAQGYGYKTSEKAIRCFVWKQTHKFEK